MKNRNLVILLFCSLFLSIVPKNIYSQITFKKIFNQESMTILNSNKLVEDLNGYSLYSNRGLFKFDTIGNIINECNRFGYTSLRNTCIKDSSAYTFCFQLDSLPLLKAVIIRSTKNLDSIYFVNTLFYTNIGSGSFLIDNGSNNSLVYGGSIKIGNSTYIPEFGLYKIDSNLFYNYKDTSIQGFCEFVLPIDSTEYLVGINTSFGPVILEVGYSGSILSQKRIISQDARIISATLSTNGSIGIVCTSLYNQFSNMIVLNYSKGGAINWAKEFDLEIIPNTFSGWSTKINSCHDGGYIITSTSGVINQVYNYLDFELIRLDANGDTLWSRAHGGSNSDEIGITSIETSDHGFLSLLSTTSDPFSSSNNRILPVIIKTDSLGHTSTQCQESYFPFTVNNIVVQDSTLNLNFSSNITQPLSDSDSLSKEFNILALDGCSLSSVQDINARDMIKRFSVFPNPALNSITVKSNFHDSWINEVQIIDLLGKVYSSLKFENKFEALIDISNLAKGGYFIKINTGINTEVNSFIKE